MLCGLPLSEFLSILLVYKGIFLVWFPCVCLQNITGKHKLIVCTVQLSWDFELLKVHLVILLVFFPFSENLTVIAKDLCSSHNAFYVTTRILRSQSNGND